MGSDPSLTPELIQNQSFSTAFRGFDQAEVRAFLSRVTAELRSLQERAEHLESAWHSAEERAARPPVLDEDSLMAAVGEETASILRSARNAANDLRTRAGAEAEKLLGEARAEADRIRDEARLAMERATSAAEEAAARIVAGARAEAAETSEKSRIEADNIRSNAEKERQMTIEGANATRDRILEDLGRRRRVATVQIEQLRAGRERLIESYAVVRRTLEEAQSELSRADAEARAAADEVGRKLRLDLEPAAAPEPDRKPAELHETNGVEPVHEEPPVPPAFTLIQGSAEPAGAVAVETAPPISEESGTTSAVDELFARIRSDRKPEPVEEGPVEQTPSEETPVADAQVADAQVADAQVAEAPVAGAPSEPEPESPPAGEDEGLFQRREAALLDVEATLTRHLKRALQDEQNDVLDRLRNLKGEPTVERLLPTADEQVDRYARAAKPLLEKGAAAGADFAISVGPAEQVDTPVLDVADLARDTGLGIGVELRRRLELALNESGDDQAVLVEMLGAAYREWKTQRIERLAGDVVSAAFARGTWEATPSGAKLKWIVDDIDGPCPDCDDDALAGEIAKEEAFPTGQNHPPAHSGCRCLLVPVADAG